MKHNQKNIKFKFKCEPVEFNKYTEKSLLQFCLGGTLYMPATQDVVDKIFAKQMPALKSMVMCFEDAIRADELGLAELNVLKQLSRIANALDQELISINDLPLIFLRVRNPEQFISFTSKLTLRQAEVLTGFIFPKFYSSNSKTYLNHLQSVNYDFGITLYGMPIFEGKAIAYRETRSQELQLLKQDLDLFENVILNIRVGGTDFSSLFGVRRDINTSIYDILPVRDALSDILNFFNRIEGGYTVSAPVWEYFLAHKKDDLNDLRHQNLHQSLLSHESILNDAIDGLLREIILDKANGFVGKTVIHPSHLIYVNSMQAVTYEEYQDAAQIIEAGDGVVKSLKGNKMNEANPHRNWAKRVILRAKAFGVIESETDYIRLFIEESN
jgi:citrate lyase beta subunit